MGKSNNRKTNWKKRAWSEFSRYIRLRDALETTGGRDYFVCCTCNKRLPIAMAQAGHAIGGRGNSILLHEELVNAQCSGCNMTGNYAAYSLFMIKHYGLERWEELVILSKQPKPMKNFEWQLEYEKWKQKADGLLTV